MAVVLAGAILVAPPIVTDVCDMLATGLELSIDPARFPEVDPLRDLALFECPPVPEPKPEENPTPQPMKRPPESQSVSGSARLPEEPKTGNRGMGSDVEQWRDLVAAYFPGEVDKALCVMAHESGGNPNAKNPRSSARGLFQILGSLWAPHFGVSQDALYDPETNVRLAAAIRAESGWSAWNPVKRGAC